MFETLTTRSMPARTALSIAFISSFTWSGAGDETKNIPEIPCDARRMESGSPRSPSAASVASTSSNAPSRRTNARVSAPRARNAASTDVRGRRPRRSRAPSQARSLADTVAACANRTEDRESIAS
jgi:hypothetical protein